MMFTAQPHHLRADALFFVRALLIADQLLLCLLLFPLIIAQPDV